MLVVSRAFHYILLGLAVTSAPLLAGQEALQTAAQVRTEIPYQEGTVVLVSDYQERLSKTTYRASGNVRITYLDIVITCDEAEYDEQSREGSARGNLRFSQNRQWFSCSRAEFNFVSQTGIFYEASGFTDQEFLIRARTLVKTGRDSYEVRDGFITACQERNPKWAFTISLARVEVNQTARLRHTFFKVKGVPVLYSPYAILPMESRKRNSGLLPPHFGNSDSKGRAFSLGYFQTLGRSADATVYGDYFSKRGLAMGGIVRARPRPQTSLYLQAYGINDRLNQGGAQLIIDAESSLGRGFRAVASTNITTNFRFRQAFSDSFRSAVQSEERSIIFLSQNQDSFATNISFMRDEVLYPVRSIVIRQFPSFEFLSLGKRLGKTPLVLELRAAADAVSRSDSTLETPRVVQRLDFYPRLAVQLPVLAGFSLVPSLGFRQTYYSARLLPGDKPEIDPHSIHRKYFDIELDLRFPTLQRDFSGSPLGSFRHTIEPFTTYRRIQGNDNMREIVRFDWHDPIADTDELEFGVVSRIFTRQADAPAGNQELLSLALVQKYYFDPQFGGALRAGDQNVFYPLNTVTGFASTSSARNLPATNLILQLRPKPGATFDARVDYDTKFHRLRDASLTGSWQQEKLVVGGTYFKSSVIEEGTFTSHHIQGLLGYGNPLQGLSASVVFSYNLQNRSLLNSNWRLNYVWDCCGIALQYQQFDLGLRREGRFTFSFSLKGIGSFGNIRRAESLF